MQPPRITQTKATRQKQPSSQRVFLKSPGRQCGAIANKSDSLLCRISPCLTSLDTDARPDHGSHELASRFSNRLHSALRLGGRHALFRQRQFDTFPN